PPVAPTDMPRTGPPVAPTITGGSSVLAGDHHTALAQPPAAGRPSELALLVVVGDPAALGELAMGDYLVLEGRLRASNSRGPPTLLFPRLLAYTPADALSPLDWLANVRTKAAAGIRRYLPEPQASLSSGLLLGGSGQLDADFRV